MKQKGELKTGDIIHIYHIFGVSDSRDYEDAEGVVIYIDDMNQIYGTWGEITLLFNDDWEIIG